MAEDFSCAECEGRASAAGAADWRRVHGLRCATDPVHFLVSHGRIYNQMQQDIPFDLYKWQRDELRLFAAALAEGDKLAQGVEIAPAKRLPRRFIRCKTRGVGETWLVAGFAFWAAAFQSKSVVIGSRTQDMAIDLLNRVKYIRDGCSSIFPFPAKKEREEVLIFAPPTSRGMVISEAASPMMGSGYHPTVFILDEWAKLEQDAQIMTSIMPAVGTYGLLIGFSSPYGPGNQFQLYWTGAEAGENGFHPRRLHWKELGEQDERWASTFTDDWYRDQCKALNNDPSMIAQELDCDFVQSGSPLFKQTDLDVIFGWKSGASVRRERWPHRDEQVIMAIDPASGEGKGELDFTSIDIIDAAGNQAWHERWRKAFPDAQRRLLEMLDRLTKPIVIVERNGMGVMYVDFLRGGSSRSEYQLVEAHIVNSTSYVEEPPEARPVRGRDALRHLTKTWYDLSKAALIYGTQSDIEHRAFEAYHRETRAELLVFRHAGTADRFSVPYGHHDDCVTSLALGRWGWRKGWLEPARLKQMKRERAALSPNTSLFDLERGD